MSRSVGKVLGAVAGAALVYFTAGAAAPWVYGVAIAAGAAYGDYVARQSARVGDFGQEPSSRTIRSSKEPAHYLLGRFANGGVLTWVEQSEGSDWIHLVIALSEGPIEAIDQVLLDKKPIEDFTDGVAQYELSVTPETVNTFMRDNSADWDDDVIGKGLSFARLSFQFDPEQFPNGLPEIQVIGRGRNDILDPRTGERSYTDNPALILLWWLTEGRAKTPLDEIDIQSFIDAANICDEVIENPDGTESKRYTMGAVISDSELTPAVIDKILATCNGDLLRVGGIMTLQVGAYHGPADFTITEDMIIGAVSGSAEVDNANAINTLTGTFTNPEDWTETDFPPVRIDEWVVEDGAELAESIQIRYVLDPYQAQRLANMRLRERRNGGALSLPMNFFGYQCRPGRVVNVDLPSLNMSGEFIVADWDFDTANGCTVQVEPYDAATFDDAVGQPYTPPGFISMPTGGIETPTNLAFLPSNDPMIKQGTVTWTPPPQPVQYYGVTIRRDGEAVQTYQVPWSATSCDIQGLGPGQYVIEIYARGELGRSGAASIPINLTVPESPVDLRLEVSNNVIVCRPLVNSPGFGTEFEMCINYLNDPDFIPFDQLTGLYGTFPGLTPDTEYPIYARTISPLGKSEWFSQIARTANNPAEIIPSIRDELDGIELRVDSLQATRQRVADARVNIIEEIGNSLAVARENRERIKSINIERIERIGDIRKNREEVDTAILDESRERIQQIIAERKEVDTAILEESRERIQQIVAEREEREAAILDVNQRVTDESETRALQITGIITAIEDEAEQRQSAVIALSESITEESQTRALAIQTVTSAIEDETSARESAIEDVQQTITDESQTRATAIQAVTSAIEDEASIRQSAIEGVQQTITDESQTRATQIQSVTSAIEDETSNRESAVLALNEAITDEAQTRALAIQAVNSRVDDETEARESDITIVTEAITDEAQTRATQIQNVTSAIETETSARESAIETAQQTISDEAQTRATAIQNVTSAIEDEVSNRQSAIETVQQSITEESQTRATAIQSVTTAIEDETSARESAIDTVQQAITDEAQTRATQMQAVTTAIEDEASTRQSAIENVQQSITDEAQTRATAIQTVTSAIEDETSTRESEIDLTRRLTQRVGDARVGLINEISSLLRGAREERTQRASIISVQQSIANESQASAQALQIVNTRISDEVSARESVVLTLNESITNESQTRATAIQTVTSAIEDEASARESAIETVQQTITDEVSTRAAQFNGLSSRIDEEESTRQSQIDQVNQAIADEASTRASAVQSLSADIDDGLSATSDRIDSVEVDVDGNAQSISAVRGQVNDPENNSSALYDFVQSAQSTADGAVSSITAIESRVENNEDFAAAQLILNAEYEDEFGNLSARAALITDNNGRITGVIIDDDGNERVVEFVADSVRFVDGNGVLKVYYDLDNQRYVFDGEIIAQSGFFGGTLGANTVTVGSVRSGIDFSSIIPNGYFETGDMDGWQNPSSDLVVEAAGSRGDSASQNSPFRYYLLDTDSSSQSNVFTAYNVPVQKPNEEFYVRLSAASGGGSTSSCVWQLRVSFARADGSFISIGTFQISASSSQWSTEEGVIAAPPDAAFINHIGLRQVGGNLRGYCGGIEVRRRNGASLIVKGGIKSDMVDAEVFTGRVFRGSYFLTEEPGSDYFGLQGAPAFGANNNLFRWFGQKTATTWNGSTNEPILSGMSTVNSRTHETITGGVYFGGTFSAGTITIAEQNTQLSTNATIETGRYGSNGGQIQIAASFTQFASWQDPGACPVGSIPQPGGVLYIERGDLTGTSWTVVAQVAITGSNQRNTVGGECSYVANAGGTITFTDNQQLSEDRRYRARIAATNIMRGSSSQGLGTQSVSIISTEE